MKRFNSLMSRVETIQLSLHAIPFTNSVPDPPPNPPPTNTLVLGGTASRLGGDKRRGTPNRPQLGDAAPWPTLASWGACCPASCCISFTDHQSRCLPPPPPPYHSAPRCPGPSHPPGRPAAVIVSRQRAGCRGETTSPRGLKPHRAAVAE